MYNFCAFKSDNNDDDKTVIRVATSYQRIDEVPPDKDVETTLSPPERDQNDDYAVTKAQDLVVVKRYENNNTDDCILEIRNFYRRMTERLEMKDKVEDLRTSSISPLKNPMSECSTSTTSTSESSASANVDSKTTEQGMDNCSVKEEKVEEPKIPPLILPMSPSRNIHSSPVKSTNRRMMMVKKFLDSGQSSVSTSPAKNLDTSTPESSTTILSDGLLDYSTLKKLLRKQRKLYKKKLDEEKTKRRALEELLLKVDYSRRSSPNLTSSTDFLLNEMLQEQAKIPHQRKLWEKSSSFNNLSHEAKIFSRRSSCRQRKSSYDSTTTTTSDASCSTKMTKIEVFTPKNAENSNRSLPKVAQNGFNIKRQPYISYFLPLKAENLEDKSLMEAKKTSFVERSRRRRQKIAEASRQRLELAEKSRDLAANVLLGRLSLEEASRKFDALPKAPSVFDRQQLFRASKKKFQMLPEIRQKREKLLQEFETCTNRIRVKMYSQKQLNKALSKPQSSRV